MKQIKAIKYSAKKQNIRFYKPDCPHPKGEFLEQYDRLDPDYGVESVSRSHNQLPCSLQKMNSYSLFQPVSKVKESNVIYAIFVPSIS